MKANQERTLSPWYLNLSDNDALSCQTLIADMAKSAKNMAGDDSRNTYTTTNSCCIASLENGDHIHIQQRPTNNQNDTLCYALYRVSTPVIKGGFGVIKTLVAKALVNQNGSIGFYRPSKLIKHITSSDGKCFNKSQIEGLQRECQMFNLAYPSKKHEPKGRAHLIFNQTKTCAYLYMPILGDIDLHGLLAAIIPKHDLTWGYQLSGAECYELAANICAEVDRIHKLNIVHNDIKLANFMINIHTLEVCLVDFGFAHNLNDKTTQCSGTEPNIAPEKLEANRSGINIPQTQAADLFSLGKCLDKLFFVSLGKSYGWNYEYLKGYNLASQEHELTEFFFTTIQDNSTVALFEGNCEIVADKLMSILKGLDAHNPEERIKQLSELSALFDKDVLAKSFFRGQTFPPVSNTSNIKRVNFFKEYRRAANNILKNNALECSVEIQKKLENNTHSDDNISKNDTLECPMEIQSKLESYSPPFKLFPPTIIELPIKISNPLKMGSTCRLL